METHIDTSKVYLPSVQVVIVVGHLFFYWEVTIILTITVNVNVLSV